MEKVGRVWSGAGYVLLWVNIFIFVLGTMGLLLLINMHIQATAPYTASDMIGQYDPSGNQVFTTGHINNTYLPESQGMLYPKGIQMDTVNHRLFIANETANRVLIYNLNDSNQLVDYQPDFIIGQTDFNETFGGAYQFRFNLPRGLALDIAGQRLFVADYNNHRVVVFDISSITNGENAVNVLGQADFTSSVQATTQTGMKNPNDVAYDASGQRLFVADANNTRILVFDVATITDGEAATNVLGKPTFTSGFSCAVALGNTCNVYALAIDEDGQRLFAVDEYERVLVFDIATITNGENPVNVLGQPDFTTIGSVTSQSRLQSPHGLHYDSANDRLFVNDYARIIVYDVASISNGENAVNVLGQPNFTTMNLTTSQSELNSSFHTFFNPADDLLYVSDTNNHRLMIFDIASITDGENAIAVAGQTDPDGVPRFTTNYARNRYPKPKGLRSPTSVIADTTGHRLFVADSGNNRILVFNLDTSNNLVDHTPDAILGQSDYYSEVQAVTQSGVNNVSGLDFDPDRNWLYVVDDQYNRILVFDVASITNGENALYVLGQSDFITSTTGISQTKFSSSVTDLTYDSDNKRLFVADNNNKRVLVFDMNNPVSGMAASFVIGQPNFTTNNTFISDAASFSFLGPDSVEYDPDHNRLFVGDSGDERIVIFELDTIANGMDASYVLGQVDLATFNTISPPTRKSTEGSQGMSYDPTSGYLWITDMWGIRVLMYDTNNIANNMDASLVIGQTDFTTSDSGTTQSLMNGPDGIFLDPINKRIYVADSFDNRILIFDTARISSSSLPGGTVGQSYSWTVASSGTQGTDTMSVTSGNLPPGLSMNASGTISGTPTSSGIYGFTVTLTDDNGTAGSLTNKKSLSINVANAPSPTPSQSDDSSQDDDAGLVDFEKDAEPEQKKPVLLNSDQNFTNESGSIQEMRPGEIATFTLNNSEGTGDLHKVTVTGVADKYVDLTVESEPIKLRIFINESKSVDVSGDGTDDIGITLLGISNGQAQLAFRLHTAATTSTPVFANPSESSNISASAPNKSSSKNWMLVIIPVVILLFSIFIVFLRRRLQEAVRR